jgi:hypothetical protein
MMLFSALLKFEVVVESRFEGERTREVSLVLFEAADEDGAERRAIEIGRSRDHCYRNGFGERVHWRFERVLSVEETSERVTPESLRDGVEVYSWLYGDVGLHIEGGRPAPPAEP